MWELRHGTVHIFESDRRFYPYTGLTKRTMFVHVSGQGTDGTSSVQT